jgi:hypothetical protein
MKKILRYSLMMLFALVSTSAMAADTEVVFTLNDPDAITALGIALPDPGKGTKVEQISKDGVTITATTADGKTDTRIYQGSGNNEGKYDFRIYADGTLTFSAGSKNIKKIVFTGKNLGNLSASGYADDTWTGGASSVTLTATATATIYTITVTYGEGAGKQEAGIAWSKATASVTLGGEDGTYKYLPTLKNPNSLSVSFDSSDKSVATIDNSGNITVKSSGTTTLTASFAGNSTYNAAEVTCELTVIPINNVTVAEALVVAEGLDAGKSSTEAYKVTGYITNIDEISAEHGNATFDIADTPDGTSVLKIYRFKGVNGADITDGAINKGDMVVVAGVLKKYVKDEVATLELVNGQIVSVTTGIQAVTIDNDANAPAYSLDGRRVNSNYRGVVIKNGKKVMMK